MSSHLSGPFNRDSCMFVGIHAGLATPIQFLFNILLLRKQICKNRNWVRYEVLTTHYIVLLTHLHQYMSQLRRLLCYCARETGKPPISMGLSPEYPILGYMQIVSFENTTHHCQHNVGMHKGSSAGKSLFWSDWVQSTVQCRSRRVNYQTQWT